MNQTEIDIEKHVLSQTKKLSDGTFEKIFVRNPRGENGMFSYNCRLCGVPNLNGERSLQTHITGRKHQQRLVFNYVPDAEQFRAKLASNKASTIVYPGEPIPPGFEDEMPTESYLNSILTNVQKPLIGLEYIAELSDSKAKEPFYICILCDKHCDPRNIIAQVTSHRHRMKYLDFHFPSLMKILNVNKKFNLDMSFREKVLTHIAFELEKLFGRQKLQMYDYKDFEKRKNEIIEDTKKSKHYSEKDFPNYEKILLEKFEIKENDLDEVSSDSQDEFMEVKDSDLKKTTARFSDRRLNYSHRHSNISHSSDYNNSKFSNSSTALFMKNKDIPKRFVTPRELEESSNQKMQEQYIIEKFKTTFEYAIREIENKYKQHEKNPENHPKYSEEWKEFWARRYKELIAEGKDANGHDYRPEWISFWTNRMKDLYNKDIERKKKEIQKKLKMTSDQIKRIENEKRSKSRSRSPLYPKRQSKSPIEISDDSSCEERSSKSGGRSRRRRIERDEDDRSRSYDSPYRRLNYRERTRSISPEIETDKEINLVTVCRLLSVLENELGILAPKVIELLSRGLAMEKNQPNSCDNLLLSNENMILIETVKEKLKGGLSTGLIPREKINPVKKAITNIAKLIHEVNERNPKMIVNKPKEKITTSVPIDQNHVTATEKARIEIARVIAEALAEQGKEDLPPEELEALIESFLSDQDENIEEKAPKEIEKNEININEEEKVNVENLVRKKEDEISTGLENLTDDDLKTLLRNFSELTSDEQNHLISYLSKIERTDPARVEKLRKYVDVGDEDIIDDDDNEGDHNNVDYNNKIEIDESEVHDLKKSPEQQAVISDDEYPDDPLQLPTEIHDTRQVLPTINNPAILVNDLMNSLNASMPIQANSTQWDLISQSQSMQDGFSTLLQPIYSHNQMISHGEYYHHQMEANLTASPWPQNSATTFVDETIVRPNKNSNASTQFRHNNQDNLSYRKRLERPNNTQLTGKGSRKN